MSTDKQKDGKPGKHGAEKQSAEVQNATGQTVGEAPLSDGEPKWTPGPWRVGTVYGCHSNIESDSGRVAQTYCDVTADQELNRANARLIAAAPDLYAALLKVAISFRAALGYSLPRDLFDSPEEREAHIEAHVSLVAARKALAKARGESDAD